MNYNFLAVIILIVLLFAGLLVFKPYRYQPIPSGEKCCYFLDTWTGQPYNCLSRIKKGELAYQCARVGNVGDISKLAESKVDITSLKKIEKN